MKGRLFWFLNRPGVNQVGSWTGLLMPEGNIRLFPLTPSTGIPPQGTPIFWSKFSFSAFFLRGSTPPSLPNGASCTISEELVSFVFLLTLRGYLKPEDPTPVVFFLHLARGPPSRKPLANLSSLPL